jgi:hypothetical protein
MWEMVDDLEAMGVPVLGDLEGFDLDKLKKKMLFAFINSNPDYDEVVKDNYRHISDYPGMYSHCVQVYSRLKPAAVVNGNCGGNRGAKAGGASSRRDASMVASPMSGLAKLRQCSARSLASTRSLAKLPMRTPVALPSPTLVNLVH